MRPLALLTAAGLLLAAAAPGPLPRRVLRPAAGPPAGAEFSPDGHLLATTSPGSPAVAVFETRTGLLLRTFVAPAAATALAFAPSPDTALCADASGGIHAWNPETLAPLGTWQVPAPARASAPAPGPVLFARFVPGSGRVLLVAAAQAWVWDVRQPAAPAVPVRFTLPPRGRITALALSADGLRFALGLASGQVLVQALAASPEPAPKNAANPATTAALATTPVQDVYFGRDTLYAAAGTAELLRWVPTTTVSVPSLPLPEALVSVEADGPDHLAVLGFASGTTAVWDLARNAATYTAQGPGPARQARFQPLAGGLIMANYQGHDVRTWKVW